MLSSSLSIPSFDVAAAFLGSPKAFRCPDQSGVPSLVAVIQGAAKPNSQKLGWSTFLLPSSRATERDSVLEQHDGASTWLVLPFSGWRPPVASVTLEAALSEIDDPIPINVAADAIGGGELDFGSRRHVASPNAGIVVLLLS